MEASDDKTLLVGIESLLLRIGDVLSGIYSVFRLELNIVALLSS